MTRTTIMTGLVFVWVCAAAFGLTMTGHVAHKAINQAAFDAVKYGEME